MNKRLGIGFSLFLALAVMVYAYFTATSYYIYEAQELFWILSSIVAIGYVSIVCAYVGCADKERRVAAYAALAFSVLYASLYLIIVPSAIYAKTLSNYYMVGRIDAIAYVLMFISTAFLGICIKSRNKADKWLKWLASMFGVLVLSSVGFQSLNLIYIRHRDVILTELCTVYFLAVSILSLIHFHRMPKADITDALPPQDMTNDEAQ